MRISPQALRRAAWCALVCYGLRTPLGLAQSGSMYGSPDGRRPLMLGDTSWYFVELEPPRELRRNDLVTVVVQQSSQVIAGGNVQRTQRSRYDAVLSNWVKLVGLDLKPDAQLDGSPHAKGTIQAQHQTDMALKTQESMKFRITAHVADIRPNGTIVLEAHQTVRDNNEVWEASLTGIARREDILPDNTVLSQNLADLNIIKREQGHVRDSYKRGWLFKFLDYVRPF